MKQFWQNELTCIDRSVRNLESGTTANAVVLNLSLSDDINGLLHRLGRNDPLLMYTLLLSGLHITAQYFWDVQKSVSISPLLQKLKTETTFGKMIPLHVEVENVTTFSDYVKKTRDKLLTCYEHQDYPVEELWEADYVVATSTDSVVFCASFQGLHSSFDETSTLQEYLKFLFSEEESNIEVEIHYDSTLYKPFVMESFLNCWSNALEQLLSSPNMLIKDTQFIGPQDLLNLKAQSSPNYLPVTILESNLITLLKESVSSAPYRSAVWSHHGELNFMEFDKRSDQIASHLLKSGAVKGEIIGLEADRSEQTIAGIFGILKAGCAYLPLDPTWPELRVKDIISNAGISKIIITGQSIQGIESSEVIDLNQPLASADISLFPEIQPNDLAYVLYTSGSTGKPKGTMIEHRNVINLIEGLTAQGIYNIPGQRVACVAPFYFDASVSQIFSSLLLGHSLYIVPEHTRLDGEALLDFYIDQEIDISDGTPMHLRMLTVAGQQHKNKNKKIKISQMKIGGEALPYNVVSEFTEAFPDEAPLVINVYGPTECCVDTTAHRISPGEMTHAPSIVPIGKPMMNQSVYILDKNLEFRPEGAPGNLYIAGLNVGRGYLQLPELTQERFIRHPDLEGAVLYKTGDLARWIPDGVVEFLGRADFQIKYNGYRIEPGDIEQAVLKYKYITAALVKVISLNENQQLLALYYTSNDDVSYEKLKIHLSSLLPSYMLPQVITHLDQFPLMANGKIAINRLPIPEMETSDEMAADGPKNHVEQKIFDAWTMVLGGKSPGMNHSFFEWGGDSLKALQLKLELEKRDIQLKLHDIFQYQTIRRLSQKWMDLNIETKETKRKIELYLPELFQQFKLKPEEKSLYIQGHNKKMWVLEGEGEVESMLSFVKQNYVKEVYPHYIARSENQDQWKCKTFRPNLEKEILEILNDVMKKNDLLSKEITQNPIIERFDVSPMQKAFLGISNSYSGVILTVDTILEEVDIQNELECIIKNEVLLHCSLTHVNNHFEWNEHTLPSHLSIPSVDLRLYTPKEQSHIMQILNSRLFYENYALTDGKLFRISVVRMNEREYQIVLACHHAIYDEMSGDYIQKVLTERLEFKEFERTYPTERKMHYREYVEQILKGPNVPEQKIIDSFFLDRYDKASKNVKKWLDQHTDGVLRNFSIEVPLVKNEADNSSEFFFDVSIHLIQSFCYKWLGIQKGDIPLLLFNYGRRYEHHSYYDMFGVFIDIMPYVLSEGVRNYNDEIRQLLKTMSEQNINFTAFLYGKNETYSSENIAKLVAPKDHTGVWFNYHGKIEDDKLNGLKTVNKPVKHETDNHHANQIFGTASVSFDVSYTNEYYRLSLTVPYDINTDDTKNEIHSLIYEKSYMSTGIR